MSGYREHPGHTRRQRTRANLADRSVRVGQELRFNWTNDEWANAHLPTVRIAAILCASDATSTSKEIANLHSADGVVPELLREFTRVRDHLKEMMSMIDAAQARMMTYAACHGEKLSYPADDRQPLLTSYANSKP